MQILTKAAVRPSRANISSAIIGIGYTPAVCFVWRGQRIQYAGRSITLWVIDYVDRHLSDLSVRSS
jgi:hypothetical protein